MRWPEWQSIGEEERKRLCQQLSPYEDWSVFKEVEKAFLSEFGSQEGIAKIFCGVGGGLGGLNSVTVSLAKGKKPTTLPESFMGFPIIRAYEKTA